MAKEISRREFLKVAGVAGATVGLAGGLGGVIAACGKCRNSPSRGHGKGLRLRLQRHQKQLWHDLCRKCQ